MRRYLPWAALAVCLLNWLWSIDGSWWIQMEARSWADRDCGEWRVYRGIYSEEGNLVFGRDYVGLLPYGAPPARYFDPRVHVGGRSIGYDAPHFSRDRGDTWPISDEHLRYAKADGVRILHVGDPGRYRDPLIPFRAAWDGDRDFPPPRRFIAVSWWLLTLLAGIVPGKRVIPAWWRRRRPKPGYCGVCGDDLRATPARCPECGTVVTARKPG